jgi:hypothetical protein
MDGGGIWFRFPTVGRNDSLPYCVQPALGPTSPRIHWLSKLFPHGVERPEPEASIKFPSTSYIKNTWRQTYASPYVFNEGHSYMLPSFTDSIARFSFTRVSKSVCNTAGAEG